MKIFLTVLIIVSAYLTIYKIGYKIGYDKGEVDGLTCAVEIIKNQVR